MVEAVHDELMNSRGETIEEFFAKGSEPLNDYQI